MTHSEFIAGLIGPTLIAISLAILTNRAALEAMIGQIAENYAVVFMAGLLLFVCGIAIVRLLSDWGSGWPSFVTAYGWLSILGGLVRMMIPDQSEKSSRSAMILSSIRDTVAKRRSVASVSTIRSSRAASFENPRDSVYPKIRDRRSYR